MVSGILIPSLPWLVGVEVVYNVCKNINFIRFGNSWSFEDMSSRAGLGRMMDYTGAKVSGGQGHPPPADAAARPCRGNPF